MRFLSFKYENSSSLTRFQYKQLTVAYLKRHCKLLKICKIFINDLPFTPNTIGTFVSLSVLRKKAASVGALVVDISVSTSQPKTLL